MSSRTSLGPSVTLAVNAALIVGGVWWWRLSVFHARSVEVKGEPWTRVQEQYPLPQEPQDSAKLSPELSEAVISANPFSPKRRFVPSPGDGGKGGGGATTPEPIKPKFTFKGLIKLGASSRAIVEDTVAHKTYFLEVGQEVAGFKVLDIAENRVVLSDLQTREEVVVSVASKASP